MNIIIYEDNKIQNFKPFSLNHAMFELQCGLVSNLERVKHWYKSDGRKII